MNQAAEQEGAELDPQRTRAPNVVMIVLDDLGFADIGAYGSNIATPNIDKLADQGLRYNSFHVTATCSPTRACLLTGRNHHRVGMGMIPEDYSDTPGFTGRIPKSAGTLPRLLCDAGYNTFAVGKWHMSPRDELSAAGPFDRWPLGMGFERFYGFHRGMTNQYLPELVRDNGFIEPPSSPENGYHLTEDLTDQAIRFIQDQQQAAPEKPFFLYFAPGAVHSPHQAPREWIESYRGQFDHGWDEERIRRFHRQRDLGIVPSDTANTERPTWVPEWDDLTPQEQQVFARQMEAYAGFLTHTDAQIGRLLKFLGSADALDNTVVLVISDNGAAGGAPIGRFNYHLGADANSISGMLERLDDFGGLESSGIYATGWAWAGNTPFKLFKAYTWLGGVRVPLIVHWPSGINSSESGQIRHQFAHAIDLMPTILDVAGATVPDTVDGFAQDPLDGRSLIATFDDDASPSPRDTQYFEMYGSRAIYHDGWKATTNHVAFAAMPDEGSRDFGSDRWSLYRLDTDFSEAHDIAGEHPQQLRRMIELWSHEADRNGVRLLDPEAREALRRPSPWGRQRYRCFAGAGPIETPSPLVGGFTFTAEIKTADGANGTGVICAHHLRFSGLDHHTAVWACYVLDGYPIVGVRVGGKPEWTKSTKQLPNGECRLSIKCEPDHARGWSVTISIDDQVVATSFFPDITAGAWPGNPLGMLYIGRDKRPSANGDYQPPFLFTGDIHGALYEPIAMHTAP